MKPQLSDDLPTQDGENTASLFTVETHLELIASTGRTTEPLFVKTYFSAWTSGLLAALSDRDWKTLCTLATYVDSDGYCRPSQDKLAHALGCSRNSVHERIQSLLRFQCRGQRVLSLGEHFSAALSSAPPRLSLNWKLSST